ncbi:chromate efflux transporter [Aphanizomenon flos-aquae NRERC-008]|jgi:chromate transporter|uniref:Chromate efflux transporter n=1 Tax=Aphanizomenon flos-aquae FACHB-1249 TaxID=2692889 RepID=A0ABR8IQZ2_APHFL|nr:MULTISPECIES: chromate efflux transporter [Aphanizomenon]MCE2904591.1 chromate efflux transporter [Anabaena sp. CoA2_C59]MDJ0507069.1 chromate efflux transporter [Nostocales cyanobacterium LE14-WE12]MBD2390680.1 chromate efflux transporter [Aphanizomenon flos-aquae FACHB-1171]MBD2557339.1 chromate efflux transporter [Aphanizomenon flos-aquae FACHB-1290]MBD2633298.1 chromate efflux transporter [Aphanizomenon sp. FACHB-1399]
MNKSSLNRLTEIAKLFLKLGIIGFGGPVAHIAMIEDEVVKRRQWLTQEHFLDLLGVTNLIPGPNSTEMAIHIGYIYAGWLGLIIAGVCFILPAVLITGLFAWLYVNYGTLPQVLPLLYGIKPVVLAIIINAIWGLGKKAVKTRKLLIISIVVGLITWFAKVNEVVALLLGGILGMIWLSSSNQTNLIILGLTTETFLQTTTMSTAINSHISVPVWKLGLFFLKVGSILFGGGYLLIAFLQKGLVEEYGWLTQQQLLDSIAIGQFTPGPVLSTATFIGYIIAGFPGATVATIGIFLPSFLFVAALNPLMNPIRKSSWTRPFLDAVNVSALALMVLTTMQLGMATLILPKTHDLDFLGLGISVISAILVLFYRINAMYLILGGSIIGWVALILGYLG